MAGSHTGPDDPYEASSWKPRRVGEWSWWVSNFSFVKKVAFHTAMFCCRKRSLDPSWDLQPSRLSYKILCLMTSNPELQLSRNEERCALPLPPLPLPPPHPRPPPPPPPPSPYLLLDLASLSPQDELIASLAGRNCELLRAPADGACFFHSLRLCGGTEKTVEELRKLVDCPHPEEATSLLSLMSPGFRMGVSLACI